MTHEESEKNRKLLFTIHHLHRELFQRAQESSDTELINSLSVIQMEALRLVKIKGSLEMGELAKEMGVTPASATVMADKLVKFSCLERVQDPNDRRLVRLTLSPLAKQKMNQLLEHKTLQISQALANFSPEERENLITLLEKLETNLKI